MSTAGQNLREIRARHQEKHAVYERTFDRIAARIAAESRLNRFQLSFEFDVMSIGCPLYDITECIQHCCVRLAELGYEIWFEPPRALRVSWRRAISERRASIAPDELLTAFGRKKRTG